MTKKVLPLFVLITLAACLLSYKVGSAPVALAKGRAAAQETSDSATPLTLPAAPATWTLWNAGGNTTAPITVTQPAGGAGVQHVATCVIATFVNSAASAGGDTVTLWDGNYSIGKVLLAWDLRALIGTSDSVNLCGLNVVGSANTPMTLSILDYAQVGGTVGLIGYDAQ